MVVMFMPYFWKWDRFDCVYSSKSIQHNWENTMLLTPGKTKHVCFPMDHEML